MAAWGAWAEASGHRRDNPFANLRRVKRTQQHKAPKSLDHRQQAALLRETAHATDPHRAATILTILLQTGLRISELCALQWGDLQLTERAAQLVVRHGKGNQERHIPFSITLRRALWQWAVASYGLAADEGAAERHRWNQRHATLLMAWIAVHPHEPVIASQKGGPLQARAIQRVIEGVAQRANLAWVTPHTLRHTYATDLLRHGAHLTEVQVLLGHASITTTSIYTQPRPDHLEQATERLAWE